MKHLLFPPSSSSSSYSLLGLLLLLLHSAVVANDDDVLLSCACALEEDNNVLDCSNGNAMLDALANLQTNACQLDCTSDVCRANYYMVQAHHDYCLGKDIPGGLSSGFHTYETGCQDCHVIRSTDPNLSSCPAANCEDTSGNAAYAYLLLNSCQQDCDSDPQCGTNFKTLRAVYDACPDGTLSTLAELGINDLAAPCSMHDCNTGDASTDASQLVCDPNDGLATRPPAVAQPTAAPTAAPDVECPEQVRAYSSAATTTGCSICGPDRCVTRPDAVFAWPGRQAVSCGAFQDVGFLGGYLTPEQCNALPGLVDHICACETAETYVPYTVPTAPAPAPIPTPAPIPAPTPASAAPPVTRPSPSLTGTEPKAEDKPSSSGLGTVAVVGIVLAVMAVVSIIVGAAFLSKRRSQKKLEREGSISEIEMGNHTNQGNGPIDLDTGMS